MIHRKCRIVCEDQNDFLCAGVNYIMKHIVMNKIIKSDNMFDDICIDNTWFSNFFFWCSKLQFNCIDMCSLENYVFMVRFSFDKVFFTLNITCNDSLHLRCVPCGFRILIRTNLGSFSLIAYVVICYNLNYTRYLRACTD